MQNRTPVAPEARPPLPDFTPVPRKYRHDGWTPERQRAFIAALADTGSVSRAAAMVNMAQTNCYTLRRAPGAEGFRRAWEAALDFGVARLKDIAFERAIDGYLVPVFVAGKLMGFRRRHNDALLMFCLRHYGQEAGGKRTTINYFSTRAGAVAGSGQGDGGCGAGAAGAMAEASATTVRTVIHGGAAGGDPVGAQDDAVARLEGFEGVALDAEAEAEIDAALLALAERQRALIAAADAGGPDAIAAQVADPGVGLVRIGERSAPYCGPLQLDDDLGEIVETGRPAGEAHWVSAGDAIPDAYREWIEAAEARGEPTAAVPLDRTGGDGVARVRPRPPRRRRAAEPPPPG